MQRVREFLKRALPRPIVEWIRRRKAVRTYVSELAYEIYYSNTSIDSEEIEARVAARGQGAYGTLLKDVLERTDLVFQQLDRRIEGSSVRTANELRQIRAEIQEIRSLLQDLQAGRPDSASIGRAGD
jgi:hypothetical protein